MITKFENMVDDSFDSDFMYQLLNDAKDEVEAMVAWEFLKKETSYSITAGYTYASAAGALPTRFALDIRVTDGSNIEYEKVQFDDRYNKVNRPFGYFIDLANDNFYLSGTISTATTVYLYYTDYSADLTSSDTWVFPARFHSIIPYKMAEIYYAADAGEKSRAWDDRWTVQYERNLSRMQSWNDSLKTRNIRSSSRRSYNPRGINHDY